MRLDASVSCANVDDLVHKSSGAMMLDSTRALNWCGVFFGSILLILNGIQTARAQFYVCNKTAFQANVAVGYEIEQDWYSRGWWQILPNDCATIVGQQLNSRYYYIYAEDTIGIPFPIKRQSANFCIKAYYKFDNVSVDNCESRAFSEVAFGEIDTGNKKHFTLYLTANPQMPTEPQQAQQSAPSYQAQNKVGDIAILCGDLDGAQGRAESYQRISVCTQAIKMNPRNAYAYFFRGLEWERNGDYQKAIDDYKISLQIDPAQPHVWETLQDAFAKERLSDQNAPSYQAQQQAQNNSNSQISTDDLSLLKCDVYARKLLGLFTRLSTDKGSDGVAFNQMMVQTFGQDGGLSTYKKILIAVGKFDEEEKRRNLISGAAADNPTWAKYSADVDNKYGQTINALTPLLNETTDCIKKYPQFFN